MLTNAHTRTAFALAGLLSRHTNTASPADIAYLARHMTDAAMVDAVVAQPVLTADGINVAAWASLVDDADAAANLRCIAAIQCPTTAYAAALLHQADADRGHSFTEVLLRAATVMPQAYWRRTVTIVKQQCADALRDGTAG